MRRLFKLQIGLLISLSLMLIAGKTFGEEDFMITSDGVSLAYDYHQVENPKGVIVMLHGVGMDFSEWSILQDFLNVNQWSTFAFDFRGHGASFKSRTANLDWQKYLPNDWEKLQIDVKTAIEKVGDLANGQPVWLIGSSLGANLAITAAADNSSIYGVILLSPGLNYLGIETIPAIQKYRSRPLLIVASKDDFRAWEAVKFFEQYQWELKKTILYDRAGHGNAMISNAAKLKEEILAWLNRN